MIRLPTNALVHLSPLSLTATSLVRHLQSNISCSGVIQTRVFVEAPQPFVVLRGRRGITTYSPSCTPPYSPTTLPQQQLFAYPASRAIPALFSSPASSQNGRANLGRESRYLQWTMGAYRVGGGRGLYSSSSSSSSRLFFSTTTSTWSSPVEGTKTNPTAASSSTSIASISAASTSTTTTSTTTTTTSNSATSSSKKIIPQQGEGIFAVIKSVLQAGKEESAEKKKKKAAADGSSSTLDKTSMTRLLEFAKPEAKTLGGAIATLGITTGISLFFPYAIGQVLDVAIAPATAFSPSTISIGLLGLFIVQSALITVRSALLNIAGERMAAHMRKDMFKAILSQDIGWFDSHRTGDIITRLSSDTVVIQKAVTSNIASGLRAGSMVVGGCGMLFYLSPSLALLSLGLIPPVALAGMAYGRYVAGQQRAVQEAVGKTMEVAEELVSSVRTVRQFAREGSEATRFATRVEESYQLARRIGIVAAYFDGVVHMAANVSLVAVLWYGGSQVSSGAMSAGELTAFLMYSLYTGLNISTLSTVYSDLKRASGAAGRLFEISDRLPTMPLAADVHYWADADATVSQPKGLMADAHYHVVHDAASQVEASSSSSSSGTPTTLPTTSAPTSIKASPAVSAAIVGHKSSRKLERVRGELHFNNVTFAYPTRPDQPVLRDFSLFVPAGSTLALVGGSGTGKSTVGALLTRLYDPKLVTSSSTPTGEKDAATAATPSTSFGQVLIDGVDVKDLDPQWLRASIGVVAQEPILFATSIAENIRYGFPNATREQVEAAAKAAHAHEFITRFPEGYNTPGGERGIQLSGGQKQRIAIARAILKNPPILILDEATSALDSESEAAVAEALSNVMKGRTTITIAHRLSTMRNADLVAVLSEGKIVEMGKFDELFGKPTSAFRQLIDRQTLGLLG